MCSRVKSIFITLTILLIICISAGVRAVESTRIVADPKWQQMTNDKAFSYRHEFEQHEVVKPTTPGALEKILNAIGAFLGNDALWRVIWILLALVAIYVVYKLLLSNEHILFSRKKTVVSAEGADTQEEMGISDWEALLQRAVNNNDLKLAVRYSYMWLLQMLQERELIKYREDKTNYDYYKELQNTDYKQAFKQISRQYEYVHYGNYPISATTYNQYIDLFNNVKKQLGR